MLLKAPQKGAMHMTAPKKGAMHWRAPQKGALHLKAPQKGAIHLIAPPKGALRLKSPQSCSIFCRLLCRMAGADHNSSRISALYAVFYFFLLPASVFNLGASFFLVNFVLLPPQPNWFPLFLPAFGLW